MSIILHFLVTLYWVILMNKKNGMIIALIVVLLIGIGIWFYFKNLAPSSHKNNYEANKTSTYHNSNQTENHNSEDNSSSSSSNEIKQGILEAENNSSTTEEQIATFSTKIYSNDSARQNNISITCNTLNETIVKNGESFSFCNTVGPSSTNKGYQEADIFDKYGNKKKGLGGRKLSN